MRTDTYTSGAAVLASDDCFANIANELISVFEAKNPEASIEPLFIGEPEIFEMLLNDSIRLAIAARDFTESEKVRIKALEKDLNPRSQKIAIDGIALIINKNNNDSLISIPTLKKIMTGEITSWKQINPQSPLGEIKVVFNHPNSSTLRFIYDSITRTEPLSDQIRALNDNLSVIDFTINTPDALGLIGVNWISNPHDSTQLSFNQNIRTMSVSRTHPAEPFNAVKPYPAYLYLQSYPLTRNVYILLTDLRGTLPAGFTHFIAGDVGQRIILKSGLVPATRPIRTIQIQENY